MPEEKGNNGRKQNQKMKPFLTYHILTQKTDEEHTLTADEIAADLEVEFDVAAERRSIYTDIAEINKMLVATEYNVTLEEAQAMIDEDEELKVIKFDSHKERDPKKKGFYVSSRRFHIQDIHLLAECIYSAKFISEKTTKKLMKIICEGLISEHQATQIKYDTFLVGRQKTQNDNVYSNILTINGAMSKRIEGEPHTPEKIKFKYLEYSIDNVNQQVERGKGRVYVVSPYYIIINDGNYYLLAFDDKSKKIRTYRVDRMKGVSYTDIPRDGEEEFKKIDLQNYTQKRFFMYSGKEKTITLRCIMPLLDTMIERFGTKGVVYTKADEEHFNVKVTVDISDQFFGWLLGFGKRVKLTSPEETISDFKAYLDKVRDMY